jgi:flagellar basal-body rod protein FlgB
VNGYFGILPKALDVFAKRTEMMAHNISNKDTPGFISKDLDFRSILSAQKDSNLAITTTNNNHIGQTVVSKYSPVNQNTDQLQFLDNALRYKATLAILSARFQELRLVIKGNR